MDNNIILRILADYPEAWRDAKRFKALLLDYLPTDKFTRNLINISIEEFIPEDIFNSSTAENMQLFNYSKRIINAMGCGYDEANRIVNMWIEALLAGQDKVCLPGVSRLTDEQLAILNLPNNRRYIIEGEQHSGKTFISILRGISVAKRSNKKVASKRFRYERRFDNESI